MWIIHTVVITVKIFEKVDLEFSILLINDIYLFFWLPPMFCWLCLLFVDIVVLVIIWFCGFREEDLNDIRRMDGRCQVMEKAHMTFGQEN